LFRFTSIDQYHADLQNGTITCSQVVDQYLASIEAQQHLNAYLEVFADEARARAKELDALEPHRRGTLHGVVFGIKDNICYKDHRVSAASKMLEHFRSLYSATAVEKVLAEGAIIIGRHNCDEFGMGSTNQNSAYGPVQNPAHAGAVPGGSSGGSAAAVSAHLCMAALGSDTGGSVRQPADFCGVVGLKPTYGNVSRHGLIAYASSFDVIGILTRSVPDAEKILQVISGPDAYDSTASAAMQQQTVDVREQERKYRIAYFPQWIEHTSIDPEIAGALHRIIESLKEQGHVVEPVAFELTDYIVPTYYVLTTAEASSNLSRYDGVRFGLRVASDSRDLASFYRSSRAAGFGKEVKRRIMLGTFVLSTGYYDAYFRRAQQVRRLLHQQTKLIFKDFDFVLAPNSPQVAYPAAAVSEDPLAAYMGDIFTVFANLSGIPSISLPLFKHSTNVPFGLQVLSAPHNEVSLLRFSHHLMQQ